MASGKVKVNKCFSQNKLKPLDSAGNLLRKRSLLSLMAATAFGTLYAVTVPVHAACTEVTSNQIVCVGDVTNAANGVLFVNTDTGPTSVTADGTITGTTGYGIYVINNNINTTSLTINAATVTGGGSGIVTTNSGTGNNSITATGEVTGGSDGIFGLNGSAATDLIINAVTVTGGTDSGIYAGNNGTGVTRITVTGTVTATDGIGIIALTNNTATDLIIDAATVSGGGGGHSLSESGIYAVNHGTGVTSITTSGDVTSGGYGIYAKNDINATDLTINAAVVTGGNDGIRVANNGIGATTITATGEVTAGIGDGISATNASTAKNLTINAATVTGGNHGIYAINNGTGATSITATGEVTAGPGDGIYATNASTATDLSINAVTVTGEASGIVAYNNGTGATSITVINEVTGTTGYGIYVNNNFSATDLSINAATVTGQNSGIEARNNGTGAISITTTGAVTGIGDYGIYANSHDALSINAATVTGGYYGIYAYNYGTGTTSITTTGKITGTSGNGIYAYTANAADLMINVGATGSVTGGTNGIEAVHDGSGNTIVTLGSNSYIQGGTGAGVSMTAASGDQLLNTAAQISSLNDLALMSVNISGSTVVNNAGLITGIINMTGNDITFNNETNGVLSMRDFSSGSKADPVSNFGGSVVFNNAGTIRFDAANNDGTLTHGTLTGIATFNHSGTIDLGTNGLAGNTLTIAGQFVSNGGSVYLNTLLDDASSNGGIGTSDRLILTDVTTGSGATKLYIQPTSNSLGALTTGNGIEVVNVSGTSSNDAFVLGRALTAGAYEYVLNQGDDQNWYLSNYLTAEDQPIYSPATGAYLSNQTAATGLFMHTLYDRQGHANNLVSAEGRPQSAWVRVVTRHGTGEAVGGSQETRTNSDLVHLGVDVGTWQVRDGNLHVGIMGAYGKSKTRVTSKVTGTWADGRLDGYSLGVYGTWFADETGGRGLYVDGWTQYSWFKNKISGSAQVNGEEKYDSRLWTISAEAGYGFLVGETENTQIMLTPQIQIAYNDYSADSHTDGNKLRVNGDKGSGTVTRVGARLYGRSMSEFTARPFVEVNWIYSDAKNTLNFNGEVLRDDVPHNRLEAKLGIEGTIAKNWTAWGQAGVQWGKDSYHRYEGQFGIKYQW